MLRLTAADNGTEVALGIGESLEICLAESPTTGYRWRFDAASAATLQVVSDHFQPGKLPGQEGLHEWRLCALAAGRAGIQARYQRSWAPDDPPVRTFSVQVQVKP